MKKAQAGRSGPLVVVQWIEVEWGKDARGAELAAKRNRLPNAFPLPALELKPESQIVVQRGSFSDRNNFDTPLRVLEQEDRLTLPKLPGVDLDLIDGQLIVTLKQEMKWTDIYRPQIVIPFGRWSRLTWNERISYEHTWRYRQTTLNLGYFPSLFESIFFDQPPLSERSDLHHLY